MNIFIIRINRHTKRNETSSCVSTEQWANFNMVQYIVAVLKLWGTNIAMEMSTNLTQKLNPCTYLMSIIL